MWRNILVLLLIAHIYAVFSFPSQSKTTKNVVIPVTHTHESTVHHSISTNRKKKGPNIPLSLQTQYQILVPNLHVIPLSNVIPVLIPHNAPVHDLTVIPLHKVSEPMISYRVHNDEEDRYRNPLGGYGVGWQFGGHGAGHGYHYSYG